MDQVLGSTPEVEEERSCSIFLEFFGDGGKLLERMGVDYVCFHCEISLY